MKGGKTQGLTGDTKSSKRDERQQDFLITPKTMKTRYQKLTEEAGNVGVINRKLDLSTRRAILTQPMSVDNQELGKTR